jgi:hypothetical protein
VSGVVLATEGTAFYEGANTMRNLLNGEPTFQGRNDLPEITKTIVMFGALKGIHKLIKTPKIKTINGKEYNFNPLNKLLELKPNDKFIIKGLKLGGESLVGGTAIFAVEGYGEMLIDTDHDWTKEEFMQAVLMYMVLRGAGTVAGRFRISKGKNGKLEAQKSADMSTSEAERLMEKGRKARHDEIQKEYDEL